MVTVVLGLIGIGIETDVGAPPSCRPKRKPDKKKNAKKRRVVSINIQQRAETATSVTGEERSRSSEQPTEQ